MGVRGLQTYLEEYCPEACYEVHLPTIVLNYMSKTGRQPEIVVDAQSCLKKWSDGLDWTLGLEIHEIIDRLDAFVKSFTSIGARLVFFMGGATPEKKRNTWLRRRIDSMNKMMSVFDIFYNGKSFDRIPSYLYSIPPGMGILVSHLLQYRFKCKVFVTIDECDEEIVRYVSEHKSFAIFAQDTDFIVSNVECLVLSSNHFNMEKMTTLYYDRHELAKKYLKIRRDQLPLFAILIGTDLLPQEILRPFQCSLCRIHNRKHIPYDVLMPAVGKFVSRLPNTSIAELLSIICCEVFNNYDRLQEVKTAYYAYMVPKKPIEIPPTDNWSTIIRLATNRMINVKLPSTVFSILKNETFECSMGLEDFRRINNRNQSVRDIPSVTVLRPLRRRLYGILLFEKRCSRPTVTEWVGENVYSYQQPSMVQPIYPKAHHPGLSTLWDESRTDQYVTFEKWNLFLGALSPSSKNIDAWSSLREDLVISVAASYYLFEHEYILPWELNAILATIAAYPFWCSTDLKIVFQGPPDLRAIQLNVTFIRAYATVFYLLSACGFPVPLNERLGHIKFEARLFQRIYQLSKISVGVTVEELCNNNLNCLKTFHQMRALIPLQSSELVNFNRANDRPSSSNDVPVQWRRRDHSFQ